MCHAIQYGLGTVCDVSMSCLRDGHVHSRNCDVLCCSGSADYQPAGSFAAARRHLSSSHSTAGFVARQGAGGGSSSAASGSGGLSHSLSGVQV